mmetsp:Transcript_25747/g.38032  ORF Transcript_25747/g.38032 Transcript_25747/m.38032 type:complete len:357 (-) Transcript_25747:460-1530(-)
MSPAAPTSEHDNDAAPTKRARVSNDNDQEVTLYQPPPEIEEEEINIRTSSLAQPTMKLTGHKGSVYTLAYDTEGECLCSGSFDMTCLLWSAGGTCDNFNVLKGHKNAILDVKWFHDGEKIVTASADRNLGWWDATSGERIKRFMGHEGVVNAVDCVKEGHAPLVISASDDCTARLWDARVRGDVSVFEHEFQVTSIAYSLDGNTVYTGGIDNCITSWDVRRKEKIMKMTGHKDTITSISLSPNGTHLLSNSMDGTLQTWDVRPFVTGNQRHDKTFVGGTHNAEKGLLNCSWSSDGGMVTGGSADRVVHIWDVLSTEELYYLPGHAGCVNSVIFHPKENVIASGSSDKSIYVGELAQ